MEASENKINIETKQKNKPLRADETPSIHPVHGMPLTNAMTDFWPRFCRPDKLNYTTNLHPTSTQ